MFVHRLAFALGVLCFSAIGAVAADKPVKAPIYNAPPVAAYNWTGCYGGINGGVISTKLSQSDSTSFPGTDFDFGSGTGSNGAFGGQLGCDYQSGNWVFGARGMLDWSGIDFNYTMTPAAPTAYSRVKSQYFATAVGRVGYTFAPQILVYVDGGAAWIHNNIDVLFFPAIPSESVTYSATGWTIGIGGEYYLGAGFGAFGEFDYMDFGSKRVCYTEAPGNIFAGIPCMPATGGNAMDVKQNIKSFLVGINYRFKQF